MSRTESWSDQRERRFRISADKSQELVKRLSASLERISYVAESVRTLVTTTYLDSQAGDYLEAIERTQGHQSLKMRVREYIALFDQGSAPLLTPVCYLERKERVGDLRMKQRVHLDKTQVSPILQRREALAGRDPVIHALRREIDNHALEPVLVTCYQRQVFGGDGQPRVTLDRDLGFYSPPANLYQDGKSLTPDVLGTSVGKVDYLILELKEPRNSETPTWLSELVATLDPAERFSKFREGMRQLSDCERPSSAVSR